MSIFQTILAAVASWFGRRQGIAEEAARQAQVRTEAENQALRQRVDIDNQVQQQDPGEIQKQLLRDWARPEGDRR